MRCLNNIPYLFSSLYIQYNNDVVWWRYNNDVVWWRYNNDVVWWRYNNDVVWWRYNNDVVWWRYNNDEGDNISIELIVATYMYKINDNKTYIIHYNAHHKHKTHITYKQ